MVFWMDVCGGPVFVSLMYVFDKGKNSDSFKDIKF